MPARNRLVSCVRACAVLDGMSVSTGFVRPRSFPLSLSVPPGFPVLLFALYGLSLSLFSFVESKLNRIESEIEMTSK